jgi:hypothetical protein
MKDGTKNGFDQNLLPACGAAFVMPHGRASIDTGAAWGRLDNLASML